MDVRKNEMNLQLENTQNNSSELKDISVLCFMFSMRVFLRRLRNDLSFYLNMGVLDLTYFTLPA